MDGEGNMLGFVSVSIRMLNLKVLLSENYLDLPLFISFLPLARPVLKFKWKSRSIDCIHAEQWEMY
jgi:hypothetical protein